MKRRSVALQTRTKRGKRAVGGTEPVRWEEEDDEKTPCVVHQVSTFYHTRRVNAWSHHWVRSM